MLFYVWPPLMAAVVTRMQASYQKCRVTALHRARLPFRTSLIRVKPVQVIADYSAWAERKELRKAAAPATRLISREE